MKPALHLDDTAAAIGVAPYTLRKNRRRYAAERGFPAPVGERPLAWDQDAVAAWLAARSRGGLGDGKLTPDAANDGAHPGPYARDNLRIARARQAMAARMRG